MNKAPIYFSATLIAFSSGLSIAHDRSVYLSTTYHQGNEVLDACADGYHFASITELLDIFGMTYNTELGAVGDDSGLGAPLGGEGWVRSAESPEPEVSCSFWTSNDVQQTGSATTLWDITDDGRHNPEWLDFDISCDSSWRVYCVSDPEEGGPKFDIPPGHNK